MYSNHQNTAIIMYDIKKRTQLLSRSKPYDNLPSTLPFSIPSMSHEPRLQYDTSHDGAGTGNINTELNHQLRQHCTISHPAIRREGGGGTSAFPPCRNTFSPYYIIFLRRNRSTNIISYCSHKTRRINK